METAVIVTTYNSPCWLKKVLWGYAHQSARDFQIVVADDGSNEATRQLIEQLRPQIGLQIHHLWQEDEGFRKTLILNKAISCVEADYLIFTDGDCIPRRDFVATHLLHARPGVFLSGGYFKLPLSISQAITPEDIQTGRFADLNWLRAQGLRASLKTWKLQNHRALAHCLDLLTPTKATWNGMNSSGWKSDLVAVNGFDERMQYGGEDCEMGERLLNFGLKARQIRHRAVCLHLDHPRPYATKESGAKNVALRQQTRANKVIRTPSGIENPEQPH